MKTMEYNWKKGLVKAVKYIIIFLLATVAAGLPPNVTQLTIGGVLVWLLNLLKVKWGVRLP